MNFKTYQEKQNIAYGGCCRSDLASSFLKPIQRLSMVPKRRRKGEKIPEILFNQKITSAYKNRTCTKQRHGSLSISHSSFDLLLRSILPRVLSKKKIVRPNNLTTYVLEKNRIYYRELLSTITVLSTLFNNLLTSSLNPKTINEGHT